MKQEKKGKYSKSGRSGKKWIALGALALVCGGIWLGKVLWEPAVPEEFYEPEYETEFPTESEILWTEEETLAETTEPTEPFAVYSPPLIDGREKRLTGVILSRDDHTVEQYFCYNEKGLITAVLHCPPEEKNEDSVWEEMVYDEQNRMTEFWQHGYFWMEDPQDRYFYNEKDQLLSRKHLNTAGLFADMNYYYDDEGRLLKRIVDTNSSGEPTYTDHFVLDDAGNIVSSYQVEEDKDGNTNSVVYLFHCDPERRWLQVERIPEPFYDYNELHYEYTTEYRFFFDVEPQMLRFINGEAFIADRMGSAIWNWSIGRDPEFVLDEDGYITKVIDTENEFPMYFLYDGERYPKEESLKEEMDGVYKKIAEEKNR